MAAYLWEARARSGELKTGVMEAESLEAVEQRLQTQLLVPTNVRKQPK